MNTEIYRRISSFVDSVGSYVYMEYGESYYNDYTSDKNLQRMYDFTGSYYFGGNNVPDTARYVVELIDMVRNGRA